MTNQTITKEHSYVEVVADTTRNGNVKVAIWEYGKGQLKSTVAKVAKDMNQTDKIRITGNDANSYIGIRAYEGSQIDATGEYVFTDVTDFSNKNFGKIYKFANAKDAILKIATGNVEDNFIFTDENLIALAYLNGHQDAIDAAAEAEIELATANAAAEVTDEAKTEFARKFADKLFRVERFSQEQVDAVVAAILDDNHDAAAVKKLIDDFKAENFNEAQKVAARLEEIIDDEIAKAATVAEMNAKLDRIIAEFDREQAEVKAETESSMVIEVKTFDSGRFTVKLNGKKIALKVLEQPPYYDSASSDTEIIFNNRKFRNVGDIKVVTDYCNVFADENGYGFFVSGISGDIWNLGKGMTPIRDMSNEIAQIEAKRKASEEMWNAIKADPLNALPLPGKDVELWGERNEVAAEINKLYEIEELLTVDEFNAKLRILQEKLKDVDEQITACQNADKEHKIHKQKCQIAEQVCASLTADAPHGWAVTFTDEGHYKVSNNGLSAATLDTITVGDFINPKKFFARFNPTQEQIDDERESSLRQLYNERDQLLNMRADLVKNFPDEKERLKILDDMLHENDAGITALESLTRKAGDAVTFDKHGNIKDIWF